ncbi:Starch-binding associating with outer membrane [Tenacibaculum sp. MAR_2009_124]|uniref:SusD/RagB family nutrient-binding outer membrane lipoprotein n=1 Tax=Tenacibaculum sp. MAR_2009_124 TaxID=1250059 RepID=UPI000897ADDA|nr:SusD/RagB family nutrient-binding outer membrane lipoprotein [Tenacibaculum sp. MAR_2009_124]SEB78242.1 Starch-binding associating with outer membrane [Tenacibaculum sp. MAR_2009_124]
MKKYIISAICLMIAFTSCEVDESLNIDTKSPSTVPASGLFTNGVRNLFDLMNSTSVNNNVFRLYAQYFAQTTYPDESQYNQVTRNIGGSIWNTLYRDVLQDLKGAKELLAKEASIDATLQTDLPNKLGIINFVEVYAYSILVDTFGNIPYTEALDPLNPTPAYDDAETIYTDLLTRLDDAISKIGTGAGFSSAQDPIYQGDVNKWKKAAISLKLRLAMRIADSNPALSQQKAEEAASAGPILSNNDNFGIKYLSSAPNTNPLWVALVQSGRNDFVAANTLVDAMNPLNDPRLSSYYEMLSGIYTGGTYGSANSPGGASAISNLMKQPDLVGNIITAAEVNFLLAEAAARSYTVSNTIEEYYNAGITTSILEWEKSAAEATAYLTQASVAYTTAAGDWKQKIATQKWIAMYNNGFEGWTTWRVFDQPTLNIPAGMTSADIPTRFLYPVSEATLNGAQYSSASSAIGGDTKTNKLFWDIN